MPVPTDMVMAQIEAVVSDIGVDVVKIGMIGSAETARAIAERLDPARWAQVSAPAVQVVVDPVMVASSGAVLADAETIEALQLLMKRATLVTPNAPELARLTGCEVADREGLIEAAHMLAGEIGTSVLAKGGHIEGEMVTDELVLPSSSGFSGGLSFQDKRISTRHTHGTGCTLASAVAVGLGKGLGLPAAVVEARAFVRGAMLAAPGFGAGHGPMGHWAANARRMNLNQVTLPARDYDEAVLFYCRLGLQQIVDSPGNGYARFECPGGATLSIHLEENPRAGDAIVYLESADLDDWVGTLGEAGMDVDQQPRDETWGWREARLRDPTGNMLCLYQAGEMRRFPPWRISTAG
jgi:hydroxymethylpyrimidine/phosphomethylpyrimidine kinase